MAATGARSSDLVADAGAHARRLVPVGEHAVGQVVDVEERTGGALHPGGAGAAHTSSRSPVAISDSRGSVTEQEPNDVNHRRALARWVSKAVVTRVATSASSTIAVASPRVAPSKQVLGGDQQVEEAVVLEAGLRVAVPDRPVQAGGALEGHLAVERGVDPRDDLGGGREGGGLGPTGAELQPQLGAGHLVGGREPGRGHLGAGQLDVDRGVLVEHALGARRVDRRDHPPGVAGQVVEVAQGDLDPGHVQPEPAARGRAAPATAPAPPVTTTDSRASVPATWARSVSRSTRLPTRSDHQASRRAVCSATASARGALPGGKMAASSTRPTQVGTRSRGSRVSMAIP